MRPLNHARVLTRLACACILLIVVGAVSMNQQLKRFHSVDAGDDALLTCLVRDVQEETVVWRKFHSTSLSTVNLTSNENSEVLTAGKLLISNDQRLKSLHDDGGDVYVLALRNTTESDSGVYACEVNSGQLVRTFHTLTVVGSSDSITNTNDLSKHNFTSCCRRKNVSNHCLGFCSLENISNGDSVTNGVYCEPDFPAIVECMADGRNHESCCRSQGVPPMCSHICRGNYYIQVDEVRDHFNCISFSEVTINCVAQGLMTLPKAVSHLQVKVLSPTDLRIEWNEANSNTPTPDYYIVNVTKLSVLEDDELGFKLNTSSNSTSLESKQTDSITDQNYLLINVSAPNYSVTAKNLEPLVLYEISVTAHNSHGSSIVSDKVRTVTLLPETENYNVVPPPGLPDIKTCCQDSGVTEPRCLRKLCDPQLVSDTALADVIICAPWAEKTFSCMADKKDHSNCCRARGLPQVCIDLCSGNVTNVDYRHFRCLGFMGSYTSCLMQGYGVVPSKPKRPEVSLVRSTYAVIRWQKPVQLAETVRSYNLHYRQLDNSEEAVKTINRAHSPLLIDSLKPDTIYEFFVEAVNFLGSGAPSNKVIFRTDYEEYTIDVKVGDDYDISKCCIMAEVSPQCMPLCHFDVKMSTFTQLSNTCTEDYPKMFRCAASGRDHAPCCRQRGVPEKCLSSCGGETIVSDGCSQYIGNVFQCFEEGVGTLPVPVRELHVTSVTNTSVELSWLKSDEDVLYYIVQYGLVNSKSRSNLKMNNLNITLNVSSTSAIINNLAYGRSFGFQVVALNEYGSSLPVSTVTVNITENSDVAKSVSSHPHGLTASNIDIEGFNLKWSPPTIIHPEDRIRYKIYLKDIAKKQNHTWMTKSLVHSFTQLAPSSAYNVYVTCLTDSGESEPSESLHVFTLAADPARSFTPVIKSQGNVTEGGSVTILCEAIGMPVPTISLFLNGMHIHSDTSYKLTTTISNMTRDLNQITCMANNGYGQTSQSMLVIEMHRRPRVEPASNVKALLNDTVSLKCHVDASPKPIMQFFTDAALTQEVTRTNLHEIILHDLEIEGNYMMELKIKQVKDTDFGPFYCYAKNYVGSHVREIAVINQKRYEPSNDSVSLCCQQRNVSSNCRAACNFEMDYSAVSNIPQCIFESDKLMSCASDGSDHRRCCQRFNVSLSCIELCRGVPVRNTPECSATYSDIIFKCFREGRTILPGPPRSLYVQPVSSQAVRLVWEEPEKNAAVVQGYRVYWRRLGEGPPLLNNTANTWLILEDLVPGAKYECAVKSGNRYGASQLSPTVVFVPDRLLLMSGSSKVILSGGAVALMVLAIILLAVIVGTSVWFYYGGGCHTGHRLGLGHFPKTAGEAFNVQMSDLDVAGGPLTSIERSKVKQEAKHTKTVSNGMSTARKMWSQATAKRFTKFENE